MAAGGGWGGAGPASGADGAATGAATGTGGATTGAGAGAWKRLGFGRLMVFAGLTGAGGEVIQLGRLSTVESRCPPGQFI